jgi:hypothetical protein
MKHKGIFVGILEVRDTACFRRPGMIRPTKIHPQQHELHSMTNYLETKNKNKTTARGNLGGRSPSIIAADVGMPPPLIVCLFGDFLCQLAVDVFHACYFGLLHVQCSL